MKTLTNMKNTEGNKNILQEFRNSIIKFFFKLEEIGGEFLKN